MSWLRVCAATVLFVLALAACGGADEGSDQTTDETSGQGSNQTTAAPNDDDDSGSGPAPAAGDNSIEFRISGGYEASGEAPVVSAMSYYSDGVWIITFGSEGGVLLVLGLDPSTPSISFTDGTASAAGDSSNCEFDITSQDSSGASGSFTCSNVAVVDSGVLTEADEFSGSFDAKP